MTLKTKLITISILSILAFFNAFYLWYDWLFSIETKNQLYFPVWSTIQQAGSLCDINDTFSCTKVANSEFSKLFWVPFAIYAMFMFFVVFIWSLIWIFNNNDLYLKLIAIPSWVWVLVNFYLFYLEFFVIKAFCPICIIISVFLFSIFFLSSSPIIKSIRK